jgi:hypothetical protein
MRRRAGTIHATTAEIPLALLENEKLVTNYMHTPQNVITPVSLASVRKSAFRSAASVCCMCAHLRIYFVKHNLKKKYIFHLGLLLTSMM